MFNEDAIEIFFAPFSFVPNEEVVERREKQIAEQKEWMGDKWLLAKPVEKKDLSIRA